MSWQRRWVERLVVGLSVGLLGGLATAGWWGISPFPSELTGLLSLVVVMPFVAVIRWFVREQRRRGALTSLAG